jgi:hypothetical protein
MGKVRMNGAPEIDSGAESLAVEAHDMEFDGHELQRIPEWNGNADREPGIFDDMFLHDASCPAQERPDGLAFLVRRNEMKFAGSVERASHSTFRQTSGQGARKRLKGGEAGKFSHAAHPFPVIANRGPACCPAIMKVSLDLYTKYVN